jgi:iron-sulfur cluster assembly accessory protein
MSEQVISDTSIIGVTAVAVDKIRSLMAEKNLTGYGLRVFVAGGGCSGLQYGMAFEGNPLETDSIAEVDGVRIIVDPVSLDYVRGASIDFVDNLMGGGFRIDNPNAVSTCGCGHSFRTEGGADASGSGGCSCGQ